jgi:hypothetical protein
MPYDLIGSDELDNLTDDELSGAIGYDVISGDDDELLQALQVSGAGTTDIVGAVPPAAARAALARRIAGRKAAMVRRVPLQSQRLCPLGILPTSIAAGVQVQIPGSPQNVFRPERLVVPADIAYDFGIVDVKVGNSSQLVQAVEVPGALFSEVAVGSRVTFDTAEVGNQISLTARNKSGAALEFTAAFLGTIAKR